MTPRDAPRGCLPASVAPAAGAAAHLRAGARMRASDAGTDAASGAVTRCNPICRPRAVLGLVCAPSAFRRAPLAATRFVARRKLLARAAQMPSKCDSELVTSSLARRTMAWRARRRKRARNQVQRVSILDAKRGERERRLARRRSVGQHATAEDEALLRHGHSRLALEPRPKLCERKLRAARVTRRCGPSAAQSAAHKHAAANSCITLSAQRASPHLRRHAKHKLALRLKALYADVDRRALLHRCRR